MLARTGQERRVDSSTAERFNLAVLAARAFDLHAGHNYLALCGIDPLIVRDFIQRYPRCVRVTGEPSQLDRRHH